MKDLAIALCRVSSVEQLTNNSLNRQQEAVEICAKEKGVEIVRYWSGSVSSKAGTNVTRTDLNEMLKFCEKNKRVKYLLVDEYDRFMRSSLEGPYFEVKFQLLGVKVWFTSEDQTFNGDDAMAKFMRSMSAYKAEGSNEERQKKSIAGGQKAIREGRLPSGPKAGYRKGVNLRSGVHEINPLTGPPLRRALKQIASNLKTPSDALKELQDTPFGKRYVKLKMDKFRSIACEPYYAGIIDLKGKFNERCENGLHEPLVSKAEHEKILRVFTRTPKNQQGHKPDKSTAYPLTNELTCITCDDTERKYPRFTSVPLSNGKYNNGKLRKKVSHYKKYKCRECSRYLDRDETHNNFSELLDDIVLPDDELKKLRKKLVASFDAKHHQAKGEIQRFEAINANIKQSIANKVDAVTDPDNIGIRDDIRRGIEGLKEELADNEEKIDLLGEQHENDLDEFLAFSFDFLSNKGKRYFELSGEDMKRCKQMLFPAKIYVDADKNVYTNEISAIFRGEEIEKDTEVSLKANVVRVKRL